MRYSRRSMKLHPALSRVSPCLALLAALGCSTRVPGVERTSPGYQEPEQLHINEAQLTASRVHCPPYQIAITDSVFNGSSGAWNAHCRNRHFACTYESGSTRCKKVKMDEPEVAAKENAAPSSSP